MKQKKEEEVLPLSQYSLSLSLSRFITFASVYASVYPSTNCSHSLALTSTFFCRLVCLFVYPESHVSMSFVWPYANKNTSQREREVRNLLRINLKLQSPAVLFCFVSTQFVLVCLLCLRLAGNQLCYPCCSLAFCLDCLMLESDGLFDCLPAFNLSKRFHVPLSLSSYTRRARAHHIPSTFSTLRLNPNIHLLANRPTLLAYLLANTSVYTHIEMFVLSDGRLWQGRSVVQSVCAKLINPQTIGGKGIEKPKKEKKKKKPLICLSKAAGKKSMARTCEHVHHYYYNGLASKCSSSFLCLPLALRAAFR